MRAQNCRYPEHVSTLLHFVQVHACSNIRWTWPNFVIGYYFTPFPWPPPPPPSWFLHVFALCIKYKCIQYIRLHTPTTQLNFWFSITTKNIKTLKLLTNMFDISKFVTTKLRTTFGTRFFHYHKNHSLCRSQNSPLRKYIYIKLSNEYIYSKPTFIWSWWWY